MRFLAAVVALAAPAFAASDLPKPDAILAKMRLANAWFVRAWPDPGKPIVTNRERPSNIWTRAVYYEGLMQLYALDKNPAYYDYAVRWGEAHRWNLRDRDDQTRNADNQCAGQTYLELYRIDPKPERIAHIERAIDGMLAGDKADDWNWIDAIQMAMPVFTKLGVLKHDARYFEKAHALYEFAKTKQAGHGLYNAAEHLWWRDKDFVPPYKEPNGANCYWSRGNGWVVAALVRVLDELPAGAPHRAEYEQDLKDMCDALAPVQRDDGFWNASLHDPKNFGGRETSGTALFVYGMAWGVRHKLLSAEKFHPLIAKGWNALANDALHPDGYLGFVQGTGKQPSEGQPTGYDSKPDFTDYGLGCFLLAGSEVHRLASGQ